MDINKMKAASYDEFRTLYKQFLNNKELSQHTISTACADAFYLWRNGSKDLFWEIATHNDFENTAKSVLIKILSEKSDGDVKKLSICYLAQLRKFRLFLSSEVVADSVNKI